LCVNAIGTISQMKTEDPNGGDPINPAQVAPEAETAPPDDRKLSRLERLKQKIRKLQGNDPDIYPMW